MRVRFILEEGALQNHHMVAYSGSLSRYVFRLAVWIYFFLKN